jgi:hypothetical protein
MKGKRIDSGCSILLPSKRRRNTEGLQNPFIMFNRMMANHVTQKAAMAAEQDLQLYL